MTDTSTSDDIISVNRARFSFTGNASEYFGIWILNLLLSILTIGIYTAWAKVRRLRYFYGNTWLDDHNFEYHAKPKQILIGRIIAVGILIVFNVLAEVFPVAALVLIIPYLLALPWLINKAMSFNARMTSYRNIRFSFEGTYRRALWVFAILPMLVPTLIGLIAYAIFSVADLEDSNASLYIGYLVVAFIVGTLLFMPIISRATMEYIGNNIRFGTAQFSTNSQIGLLYQNLALPFVVTMVMIAIVWFAATSGGLFDPNSGLTFIFFVVYVAVVASYLVYSAGVRNIAFNSTTLEGEHRLYSEVPRGGYAWVIISNLIASVFSIGLMIPWAAVRSWRFLMDHSAIETPGLDQFVGGQETQGNVAAAEYLDIDGIDFGL